MNNQNLAVNIIENLKELDPGSFINFNMDYLQENVYKNLHLELPQIDPAIIISPSLAIISDNYSIQGPFQNLLTEKKSLFQTLRRCIIDNLIEYSAIIESNSYFLHNNDFLLISRLFFYNENSPGIRGHFYTIEPREIKTHYNDKIYCGTDSMEWEHQKRKYCGLVFMTEVVMEGLKNLELLAPRKLKDHTKYKKIHLAELNDLVHEFFNEGNFIINEYLPAYPRSVDLKPSDLNAIIMKLREIKHYLIELVNLVAEFESLLIYRSEFDFAKYISKFKKDLTNFLNYLNIRLIRRLVYILNMKI